MLLLILLKDIQDRNKIFDKSINHLFYMEDLKPFAKSNQQLEGLQTIVKQFNDYIRMEYGLDKWAKATFIKKMA